MGQRARIKAIKRRVREAWAASSEPAKAALAQALEQGPLTMDEILTALKAPGP